MKNLFLILTVIVSLFSNRANAIRGGAVQELVLSGTEGTLSIADGHSYISIQGMYGYFFQPHFEGAIELGLVNNSSATLTRIFFDGIYNFQSDYGNSYFAFAGVGLNSTSGKGNSSSTSGIKFGGGKRFSMWGPVSLMPMAWIEKLGSSDTEINLRPLNFTVLF